MTPLCGQEGPGPGPGPGDCPAPPNESDVNYAVSLNTPNANLQMTLDPTTFGGSPDPKQFTGAFYFRADPGPANDNSQKHLLRIGDVNNPINLVAELLFQRNVRMESAGEEDIFTFTLQPFNQSNGTELCGGNDEEPAQVEIQMSHEAPDIIPIIFSYQSSDPIKLGLWVDGEGVETECNRGDAPATPNVQKWTFGGSQNHGAPGFGIDDLRLFADYHELEALTDRNQTHK